ncbi:MAG: GntR family transcriptional regulator [Gammaproteobacteria bacterium]|nr:GntR family transcriptional regulator [Gammaproteobacteria bacterium]
MNQASAKPLYRIVEDYLLGFIDSGELVSGDLIPSEPQLAATLGVSQGTVKKAIDNLVWEKKLFRHQGKGTYVSRIDFNNSLFKYVSYGNVNGVDIRIDKKTSKRFIERGNSEICRRMNIADDTDLLYIERVGYVDNEPVMVEYSRWRADMLPGLENEDIHVPDLFYAVVVDKYKVPVVRAEETLTAEIVTQKTAAILQLDLNSPVLVLNRTTYTRDNEIIEIRITKGRGDMFSYKTEIGG